MKANVNTLETIINKAIELPNDWIEYARKKNPMFVTRRITVAVLCGSPNWINK